MVNRMKQLPRSLIADHQNVFVPRWHMEDNNVLISHEITHLINKQPRGKKYLAALKLDMNKVYDKVN